MSIATCTLCGSEGEEPFAVPWDEIGIQLMKAHMADKHPDQWKEKDHG